jgi:hypothetical protein
MKISEIIATTYDLAGGNRFPLALRMDEITGYVLNIIDRMLGELTISDKGVRGHKISLTFPANVRTGTVNTSALALEPNLFRYRESENERWQILDIVENIENLTNAENTGKFAVLFYGSSKATLNYQLSFKPEKDVVGELWGAEATAEMTGLDALPPFPKELASYVVHAAALIALDDLATLEKPPMQFIALRKQSISAELKELTKIWTTYKSISADGGSPPMRRDYDMLEDLRGERGGYSWL